MSNSALKTAGDLARTNIIKGEDGHYYIPATQRPDGSWRKPKRVKPGYIPQDEVPVYESQMTKFVKSKPQHPVGLHPDDIEKHLEARQRVAAGGDGQRGSAAGILRYSAAGSGGGSGIPGLANTATHTATNDGGGGANNMMSKSAKKRAKQKAKKAAAVTEGERHESDELVAASRLENVPVVPHSDHITNDEDNADDAEKARRLKNLKKKLRQIVELEEKMESGDLTPSDDQLEKVCRKLEVMSLIRELEGS